MITKRGTHKARLFFYSTGGIGGRLPPRKIVETSERIKRTIKIKNNIFAISIDIPSTV